MKITNKQNLPGALVTAAHMDEYSRGASDISVTELIDSPRIRLMKQHYDNVVERDVAGMIWPMLGTAFHNLMEKGEDEALETEERYFAEVEGWTLSGQIDRIDRRGRDLVIRDYKVTSVYTIMKQRAEWASQLNVYTWLVQQNRHVRPKAEIVALARDWRPREAEQGRDRGYPEKPIVTLPMPLWNDDYVDEYVKERVSMHQHAQQRLDEHGEWPECSKEEMWFEESVYALMKKGRKSAVKLHKTKRDAEVHKSQMPSGHYIEHREGSPRRCEGYCEFAPVCTQYQAWLEEKEVTAMVKEIKKA